MRQDLILAERCQPVGDHRQDVGLNEGHDEVGLLHMINVAKKNKLDRFQT